jgi:hypothetical protein
MLNNKKLCLTLNMAPFKNHAKHKKRDLPNVINSLNILLQDIIRVKKCIFKDNCLFMLFMLLYPYQNG